MTDSNQNDLRIKQEFNHNSKGDHDALFIPQNDPKIDVYTRIKNLRLCRHSIEFANLFIEQNAKLSNEGGTQEQKLSGRKKSKNILVVVNTDKNSVSSSNKGNPQNQSLNNHAQLKDIAKSKTAPNSITPSITIRNSRSDLVNHSQHTGNIGKILNVRIANPTIKPNSKEWIDSPSTPQEMILVGGILVAISLALAITRIAFQIHTEKKIMQIFPISTLLAARARQIITWSGLIFCAALLGVIINIPISRSTQINRMPKKSTYVELCTIIALASIDIYAIFSSISVFEEYLELEMALYWGINSNIVVPTIAYSIVTSILAPTLITLGSFLLYGGIKVSLQEESKKPSSTVSMDINKNPECLQKINALGGN